MYKAKGETCTKLPAAVKSFGSQGLNDITQDFTQDEEFELAY